MDLLLDLYFQTIDPTSVNRQGGDSGLQYRTGIYYIDKDDAPVIEAAIKDLAKDYAKPIAIEVMPLVNFYAAEEYHQDYLDKNVAVIAILIRNCLNWHGKLMPVLFMQSRMM